MEPPSLDPVALGISADQLAFEAEDGRYGVVLSHHAGPIWLVVEHGFADDACGRELVALFVRLLDAVEQRFPGSRIYLCSDYSNYRGSSNNTRKAMLREVVMRPTLGAVAFWGAGLVTRSVAMLLTLALPRLAAKPFRHQQQALAYLEECIRVQALAQSPPPAPPAWVGSLDSAVLAAFLVRNADAARYQQVGGRERRIVEPEEWSWAAPGESAPSTLALVGDDVLLAVFEGALSPASVARFAEKAELALTDLGLRQVSLLIDLRDEHGSEPEALQARAERLRRLRERLLHVVVLVRDASAVRPELDALVLAGSVPLVGRPVYETVVGAFGALDRARKERSVQRSRLEIPDDRAELEVLVRELERDRLEHRRALEHLFGFVGRVSWDEGYMADGLSVPPEVEANNPFWSVYGALHLMQQDMLDVLRDREERAAELARARELAESASRAKSQFLGTVSHELRTPLNAIFGMTALLRGEGLEGDRLRHLEGIETASQHLARLIGDLLDITRIEEGVLELEPVDFALGGVVDELLERWSPSARAKGLALRSVLAPGLPAGVRGDRVRVVQILSNLLDNAIKFTERGWVRLAVSPVSSDRVAFEILDSGRGIPPDELPTVFDRFERGAGGRADVVPGVGLGLAICRQLAELMGGGISVSSELGCGTSFRVELPLASAAAAPAVSVPQAPPVVETQRDDFSDLLVLLAEDDPASRYVARRLLESLGCEVVVAEDGGAALECLQRGRYDLVLMDCQMPILDGLEVTRRFRASERSDQHTPIIALTAYAFDEDRERMLAAGMDDHEPKPVNRSRFEKLLRRWGG